MSSAVPLSHSPLLSDELAASLLEDVLDPQELSLEQPGDQIGRYRLMSRLGEGGFGVVWRAEQSQPVRREVALKLLKLGMDTVQVLTRFDQERQVLAGMEHPHIAQMLDAGAAGDGRPYFVMELVKGEPITTYCTQHSLGLRERISLFQQVCSGVQHAHQRGVIHRDLKPTNILVTEIDGEPVSKIIDFGIAKAITTDKLTALTLVTLADTLMGTPLYMSPEQMADVSDVDTRSDVYALGVLLYELLTDTLPFSAQPKGAQGQEEMRRLLRDVTPQRPSTRLTHRRLAKSGTDSAKPSALPSTVPADLDWIVLCALEKDRRRRYQSAAEFAADLQRFLNGEPVLAHPPSLAYVSSLWVRRHQVAFAAASISLLAILSGAGVALWQAAEARQAQKVAEAQATRASEILTFLTTLLNRAAEQVREGRNGEALHQALRKSLDQIRELDHAPALQEELTARLLLIYQGMRDHSVSIPLLAYHAELLTRLYGPSDPRTRSARMHHIGQVADHGIRAEAPAMLEALRKETEDLGEKGSPFWFRVMAQISRVWLKLDYNQRALDTANEAEQEAEKKGVQDREWVLVKLAKVPVLETLREFDQAEAMLEECRSVVLRNPQEASLVDSIDPLLVRIFQMKGDPKAAAQCLERRIGEIRASLGARHPQLILLLRKLAEVKNAARLPVEAVAHAQESFSIAQEAHHQLKAGLPLPKLTDELMLEIADLVMPLQELATSESKAGMAAQATQHALEALVAAERSGRPTRISGALRCLTEVYEKAGDLDQAYLHLHRRYLLMRAESPSSRTWTEDLQELSRLRLRQNQPEEAMKLAQELWTQALVHPAIQHDPEHLGHIANQLINGYKAVLKARPGTPEPAEMATWREASATGRKMANQRLKEQKAAD